MEAKKMKKSVLLCCLLLGVFCIKIFSVEIALNGSLGIYGKDHDLFKQLYSKQSKTFGVGMSVLFFKFSGFYLDAHYMFAKGESTYYKKPLSYNELHLSGGLKLRLKLFQLSPNPNYKLYLYFKVGGIYIRYVESFEEKISGNVYGGTVGGGINAWFNRFGIGIEVMKNFATKNLVIQGLDTYESTNFGGLRIVAKGVLRLKTKS
jgi:hypothetical protein